ncbi:MAG: 2'-5' RNA ligase family protein [Chitinophaga sp.]|uniref:2'-5' RNA ligase family protein n=1 Tax=Chitinophaga sp. TaxID=1869181 RepID=UPI001B07C2C9|nr:2'-5' RNA ligase family protein [Chitinophaga sp.]MBO9729643.1 2'-5' RNA ligase family protein [Chitinophaga sp.]
MTSPLILTLQLSPDATGYFNQLRRTWYPAYANVVEAHLTLFHRLPADVYRGRHAFDTIPAPGVFTLEVTGLQRYPHGVACTLFAAPLQAWHQSLQQEWGSQLIWRDQQPLQPHITIMNKVTDWKAQRVYEKLLADFQPPQVQAIGVQWWRFEKGPWTLVDTWPFDR